MPNRYCTWRAARSGNDWHVYHHRVQRHFTIAIVPLVLHVRKSNLLFKRRIFIPSDSRSLPFLPLARCACELNVCCDCSLYHVIETQGDLGLSLSLDVEPHNLMTMTIIDHDTGRAFKIGGLREDTGKRHLSREIVCL
ncbi:unnamed protein product [Periconia digitata]|uniref:Uncharacterized protein n=1 Tax=Periconia digitata TaxID=1303443 RepID=A0A9W4UHF4_9PLEO|nr:unnamed protein product [Periconia digitata]